MRASVIALGLPLLAAGARHAHQHVHRNAHALVDRAIYTEVVTVTEIVTVAVEAVSSTSTMITGVTSTSTNPPVVSLTTVLLRTATNFFPVARSHRGP